MIKNSKKLNPMFIFDWFLNKYNLILHYLFNYCPTTMSIIAIYLLYLLILLIIYNRYSLFYYYLITKSILSTNLFFKTHQLNIIYHHLLSPYFTILLLNIFLYFFHYCIQLIIYLFLKLIEVSFKPSIYFP